jgi:hypothetical protein
VRHAAICRKFRFEGRTFAAQDIPAARQDAIYAGNKLALKRRGLSQQVVQGDWFRPIRGH